MARLRHNDLIKAVGTTGKHSVMLALVVALVWRQEEKLHNLSKALRGHRLEDEFWDVLESAKVYRYETSRNVPKDRTGTAEHIDLHLVCDRVPVLSINKPSVLPGFVSWLLQMALSSEERADSLYEYCEDDEIADACVQLGFKRADLLIVRLTQEGLCHIKAVGANGKRSAILAAVVACLLCEVIGHKALLEKVCRENSSLHEPLMSLIRRITSERQWRDEETENRSRKRKQAVRRSAMDERSTSRSDY